MQTKTTAPRNFHLALIASCIEASCAEPKHSSRAMLTMDDITTAWELVIRSRNVDLLRTTLGGVDRSFYRFARQLKFDDFFTWSMQIFSMWDSSSIKPEGYHGHRMSKVRCSHVCPLNCHAQLRFEVEKGFHVNSS